MSRKIDQVILEGISRGLLAPHASAPAGDHRPWPVLVMIAVGAWLSAVPLALFVGFMFSELLKGGGAIAIGGLIVAGAIAILRKETISLYVEQLALPGMIAGVVLLGIGIGLESSPREAAALLVGVLCVIALLVPRNWLRALLGIGIAGLIAVTVVASPELRSSPMAPFWLAGHAVVAVWIIAFLLAQSIRIDGTSAKLVAALEAVTGGLGVAALAGLAFSSGRTFLVGGFDYVPGSSLVQPGPAAASVVLAMSAACWLATKLPVLRTAWFALLGAAAAILAWFLPSLGAALLILAAYASCGRPAMAALAGVAAGWMIGSLYYHLAWPLAYKGALLTALGAVLGAVVRFVVPEQQAFQEPQPAAAPAQARTVGRSGLAVLISCGLVLAAVNVAIWQKEMLIANGTTIFVELAPVDPRSLMQGDYMTLNFVRLDFLHTKAPDDKRALAVARADKRGVTELLRWHDGRKLAAGEFPIELIQKGHRWVLVTDAWYFAEGEAERWGRARYGEFRVTPDGRALLVGMRGARLEKL